MKHIFLFLIVTIVGCANPTKKESIETNEQTVKTNSESSDSVQIVKIVSEFFQAFDERDLQKIDSLLIPSTQIIHYNGITTNTAEMIKIIKETKDWYPRTRQLSNYKFFYGCDLAVIGLTNDVTFSLPKKKVIEKYIETWTFEKIKGDWKPVRSAYSKVIADKHSEEVK